MKKSSFSPGIATEGGAETELHGVAWVGDIRRAKRLIRHGANVNFIDSAGETPLHGAAACGWATMVRLLLAAGARHDIHAANTNEMTPLHWAAGWGSLGAVRALIKAGADPDAKDVSGRSAAAIAKEHGQTKAARYLERIAANKHLVPTPGTPRLSSARLQPDAGE